ncbi:MAG: septum formation initiator family protein [Ruminococcaceae bacterium]|nr:septum formation initiator family protein [Oscillospiraceae bacterium]
MIYNVWWIHSKPCGVKLFMNLRVVFSFVLKAFLVVAALYLSATFVSVGARLTRTRELVAELEAELAAQRQVNDELQDMVENGITEDYIIKKARSYGYVLPGETVYADLFGK